MKTIKYSAMRLALIWGMVLLSILFISVGVHIVTVEAPDWSGIGIFLVGSAAFIGALVTGKYLQKKVEVTQDNGGTCDA